MTIFILRRPPGQEAFDRWERTGSLQRRAAPQFRLTAPSPLSTSRVPASETLVKVSMWPLNHKPVCDPSRDQNKLQRVSHRAILGYNLLFALHFVS